MKVEDWAYGVTTVPGRRDDLLPRTLESLKRAGFDKPRLFVDGDRDPQSWEREFGLEVTTRWPKTKTVGNWILSLWELHIRNPWAIRYAIFQDDFVTVRNLKTYLEHWLPPHGYQNLYSFPSNESLAKGRGWHVSNQRGLGAVALVFSQSAARLLLSHDHMMRKPGDPMMGDRKLDGAVVDSFRQSGWKEWVHYPSLVQHTGQVSSMGNNPHELSKSFPGEDFDALTLLDGSAGTGEAAYAGMPQEETLRNAWRKEVAALERAIADDRIRLSQAGDHRERRHFETLIWRYSEKLRHLQINQPPWFGK